MTQLGIERLELAQRQCIVTGLARRGASRAIELAIAHHHQITRPAAPFQNLHPFRDTKTDFRALGLAINRREALFETFEGVPFDSRNRFYHSGFGPKQ